MLEDCLNWLFLKFCNWRKVKVILIKNIVDGLFNGMIGIVYYLERGSFLVVNFSVNLVIVFKIIFKVYDSR